MLREELRRAQCEISSLAAIVRVWSLWRRSGVLGKVSLFHGKTETLGFSLESDDACGSLLPPDYQRQLEIRSKQMDCEDSPTLFYCSLCTPYHLDECRISRSFVDYYTKKQTIRRIVDRKVTSDSWFLSPYQLTLVHSRTRFTRWQFSKEVNKQGVRGIRLEVGFGQRRLPRGRRERGAIIT